MNLKNDMENMKDDVKKGLDKVGDGMKNTIGSVAGKFTNAVKHTAMELKDDVVGMVSNVTDKANDMKDEMKK